MALQEQGLAGMGQQQAPQGQIDVGQVAQLLMQGVTPQELQQQGVPVEIIQQAIAMLEQQAMQEQQTPAGLAAGQGLR